MKKIAFFIGSLSGGGSERVCVNLANAMSSSEEWKVNVVILNNNDDAFANDVSAKVTLKNLQVNNARFAPFPLLKFLKKEKIDIAVAFSYELTVLLVLLKKIFNFKFTIISRNVNNFTENINEKTTWWRGTIAIPIIRKMYSQADFYINQCEGMRNDLLKTYPKLANKSCVIYNPIKDRLFDYRLTERSRASDPYILCVGRLEKQKNFSDAIESFYKASKKIPLLKLIIIGKGSLENTLKKQAKSLGVEDRVLFEGFKNNVEDYYYNAVATMLTSNYEGFPNVLLESIALGTPVISYDCPSGPSEIITPGINGYLVEHKNTDVMAEYIIKTCEEPLNENSIKETAHQYKSDVILDKYLACITDVHEKLNNKVVI